MYDVYNEIKIILLKKMKTILNHYFKTFNKFLHNFNFKVCLV